MITNAEQEILYGICKESKTALLDIHTILSKVYDDELALDLNLQAARYSRLEEKAADSLREKGISDTALKLDDRTKRWASLQAGTVFNVSTSHIADMMIQKKEERLTEVKKTVDHNPVVHNMVYELAEEFLGFEEDTIRILKSYL